MLLSALPNANRSTERLQIHCRFAGQVGAKGLLAEESGVAGWCRMVMGISFSSFPRSVLALSSKDADGGQMMSISPLYSDSE